MRRVVHGVVNVCEKYKVNFSIAWTNILDTCYVLSALPEAGELVVPKTKELPLSWSVK